LEQSSLVETWKCVTHCIYSGWFLPWVNTPKTVLIWLNCTCIKRRRIVEQCLDFLFTFIDFLSYTKTNKLVTFEGAPYTCKPMQWHKCTLQHREDTVKYIDNNYTYMTLTTMNIHLYNHLALKCHQSSYYDEQRSMPQVI